MNKQALGTILGAALLGLAKKGSMSRKLSLNDFFKKKVGNKDQTFKIYFRIKYFPKVEYRFNNVGYDIFISNDLEYDICSFLDYAAAVGTHINECDQLIDEDDPDIEWEEVDVYDYFDGTISWFGEQWLDEPPLQMMEAAEWTTANTIYDNSQMFIDSPSSEYLDDDEDIVESIADGYLEVKLNLETFSLRKRYFIDYIYAAIYYGYERWLDGSQDPSYVDSNSVGYQIIKVEPDIFAEHKSNLRKR